MRTQIARLTFLETMIHKLMNTSCKLHCAIWLVLSSLTMTCDLLGQSGNSLVDPTLKLKFDFNQDFSAGRVLDVSSNGNDGLQFNPTNWITATNGVFGTPAASFRRVGVMTNDPPQVYPLTQYIAVTNLNGIKYLTNGTISMWARFDATNNGHNLICLMDCGYTAAYAWSPSQASNSWTWAKGTYQNYLSFWVYPYLPDGGGRTLVRWPDDTVGGDNESTTSVHLYTITIDCPNNQVIAYYDGEPYMSNTIDLPWLQIYGTSSIYWVNWLCIGASSHDGTPQWGDDRYPNDGYFTGIMDDIRIYNRTLSAAEVQALYFGYGSQAWNPPLSAKKVSGQSVQLLFGTVSNVSYQVEYRPVLTTSAWTALGAPLLGNGGTNSLVDPMNGQASGFYRVRPLP
jgi:hypothetical protein